MRSAAYSSPKCSAYSARIRLSVKMTDEYKEVMQLPAPLLAQQGPVGPAKPKEQRKMITAGRECTLVLSRMGNDV